MVRVVVRTFAEWLSLILRSKPLPVVLHMVKFLLLKPTTEREVQGLYPNSVLHVSLPVACAVARETRWRQRHCRVSIYEGCYHQGNRGRPGRGTCVPLPEIHSPPAELVCLLCSGQRQTPTRFMRKEKLLLTICVVEGDWRD